MKLTKSLFLAFAGLGLFACSNEDVTDNNGGIQGAAEVAVTINLPGFNDASRALGSHASGTSTKVEGEMKVTLLTAKGSATKTVNLSTPSTQDEGVSMADNKATVVFGQVENPQSVTVSVNGYEGADLNTLAAANPADGKWNNLKAPMYGQASGVVNEGSGETNGKIVRGEDGNYTTSLTLNHVVGRLEFSGIKHESHDGGSCIYEGDITLSQISLWKSDEDEIKESPFEAKLFNSTNVFPENGCYAYNVIPNTLPELRLKFTNVAYTQEYLDDHNDIPWNEDGIGYAAIKEYKLDESCNAYDTQFGVTDNRVVTKFPAGFVYQVKDLTVADKNIHEGDPSAEGVSLTAVITVTPWTVVTGSATWK